MIEIKFMIVSSKIKIVKDNKWSTKFLERTKKK